MFTGLTAAVSLVALTGCSKPTPIVSMVSGGQTVHTDATLYCFDGQSIAKQDCRTVEGKTPTVLKVKPGQQVGIDVSRDIAKSGWVVVLPGTDGSQDQSSGAQDSHYLAFTPQFTAQAPQVNVDVRMLDHGNASKATIGLWRFVLVPA